MTRQVNKATIDLIKEFEGVKLRAYPDPGTGGEPWTIGVGHTGGVKRGDVITMAQAEAFLREDLEEAVAAVERFAPGLNDNQFGALVSFTFNTGAGNLRKLLSKGIKRVPERLGLFVYANRKALRGLVRRRAAERALFLKK